MPPTDALSLAATAARRFYDEVADTYAARLPGTDAELPIDLAMIHHLLDLVPAGGRILDAGCGAGRLLPLLASRGAQVDGIDISCDMVRRAREDHPAHPVVVAELTALPHDAGALDAVVSWYSTIHIPDDELACALVEIRRVLQPGGHVLLAFQTGDAPRTVGHGFAAFGHQVSITRWHRSLTAMTALLERSSFEIAARLERAAHGAEPDGQGFMIGRAV